MEIEQGFSIAKTDFQDRPMGYISNLGAALSQDEEHFERSFFVKHQGISGLRVDSFYSGSYGDAYGCTSISEVHESEVMAPAYLREIKPFTPLFQADFKINVDCLFKSLGTQIHSARPSFSQSQKMGVYVAPLLWVADNSEHLVVGGVAYVVNPFKKEQDIQIAEIPTMQMMKLLGKHQEVYLSYLNTLSRQK